MALNQLQDFYKQTIITPCGAGAGKIYVSAEPVPVNGYLVISPSNQVLREVVRYTGKGTDSGGAYVTIANGSDRGLGGTSAQSHAIGESIRMNITAEHWADLIAEITGYAPTNNPTFTGHVHVPTPTDADDAVNKAYVDTQGFVKAGDNTVFTGLNTFTQSPKVPDAVNQDEPATLKQLMDAALNGVDAGLNYFDVLYHPVNGRLVSVHDNVKGKTYVFTYNRLGLVQSVTDGKQRWYVNRTASKVISVVR